MRGGQVPSVPSLWSGDYPIAGKSCARPRSSNYRQNRSHQGVDWPEYARKNRIGRGLQPLTLGGRPALAEGLRGLSSWESMKRKFRQRKGNSGGEVGALVTSKMGSKSIKDRPGTPPQAQSPWHRYWSTMFRSEWYQQLLLWERKGRGVGNLSLIPLSVPQHIPLSDLQLCQEHFCRTVAITNAVVNH